MGAILTCRELCELLTDRDEGAISALRRAQVKLHLTMCGKCRVYEQQFEASVGVLRALGPSEASGADRPRDMDALRDALRRPR